ncbi:MAG: ParB/RepB/Spo0J family partition protein [Candidatus Nomurabacteria bacterium]|jgi:ParB family chromosome partitioning protein|nr:ParB/RepB/Spo0J family partition protein [Candidatus Nomurabacteria bacterium]
MVKHGLGRGFDDLIPTTDLDAAFDPMAGADGKVSSLREIPLDQIQPNSGQPRRQFDGKELDALAESIKKHGVLQPIVVAPKDDGFEIVAGERRFRASKLAGLKRIPAIVRTLSDQHKLELSLIENVQRSDLNAMEIAAAYQKLRDQFNLTLDDIAARVGKTMSAVSNHVRLLRLPDFAKKEILAGKLSEGHGRQLLALDGDEAGQKKLLDLIIKNGWSVRKTEQFVIGYKKGVGGETNAKGAARAVSSQTDFTKSLSKKFRLPVRQKITGHGGQIIISYKTDDELEQLKKLIG